MQGCFQQAGNRETSPLTKVTEITERIGRITKEKKGFGAISAGSDSAVNENLSLKVANLSQGLEWFYSVEPSDVLDYQSTYQSPPTTH